jgi:GNAT superfamily N-acetyltransferase
MAGLRRGLPNSVYGVVVAVGDTEDGDDPEAAGSADVRGEAAAGSGETVVGTARIVGDGGSVYHVCDMVVHPDHQGRGVGTRMMDALMAFVEETAPPEAYVNLMADVDGFYERWGFERTAPASKGMFLRTG